MYRVALPALLIALPAWAGHPLITEDTNVLGKGVWELELHGERARDHKTGVSTRRSDSAAKLGYGIAENADLEVELPYVREVTGGEVTQGRGDASAGRLRWAVNLAGAYETGKPEFLAHLGYTDNRNRIGERRSLWHASAAVLYSLTEKLRLLADYGRDSQPDPAAGSHGREFVVGATYALSERVDLGIGLKKGLNDAADDRALRAGVKLRW